MADEVVVVLRPADIAALATDAELEAYVHEIATEIATDAAARAPRRTGAGAASIHAERIAAGEEGVGWDDLHYYMRFQDLGTKFLTGKHFLEQAADRYARP